MERVRRGAENARTPDEGGLQGVRQRSAVYEQTKREALDTLKALRALL